MPKHLYDNSNITSNSKQLELLKHHFPNCFDREGNFISHKMQEIVGESGLDLSRESYSLNWLGKSYARLLANENPRTLLREDKEHNSKEANQNSENLLIKGDNLEVLKHLTHAYSESIKMIYIDPPYNTGGDGFVYNDDRKFTVDELSRLAGIDADESKRILEFTASKANSHSAWLTFMYPRLYVARELLREDGVIFISIDDNEVSQLKLLCDEVFGEENFVAELIWSLNSGTQAGYFTRSHETILVYSKDLSYLSSFKDFSGGSIKHGALKKIAKVNPSSDLLFPKGTIYCEKPNSEFEGILGGSEKQILKNKMKFDSNGLLSNDVIIEAGWAMKNQVLSWLKGKETFDSKGQCVIRFYFNSKGILFYEKERGTQHPKTVLLSEKVGNTREGGQNIIDLFGVNLMSFPKPIKLIKFLTSLIAQNKNDIVLDFFAGSGTTAHAVMALNAEDQGNRKFITVQIDEKTDKKSEAYKAGYESIFDITKARIEKASEKLNDKSGFKIYETTPIFEGYLDDLEELSDNTTLFNGSELTNDELETLLTTWKVHDGMRLHESLEALNLGSYVAYASENTVYFMDKGFNLESLQAFVAKLDNDESFEPSKLVLFGYNFDSKHQREFKEALANYSNKKSIELDMVVRY